jgi:hypothetical protein
MQSKSNEKKRFAVEKIAGHGVLKTEEMCQDCCRRLLLLPAARASERDRERRETKRCCVYRAAAVLEAAVCLRFRVTIPFIIILINAFFYVGKTQSHFDSNNNTVF